MTSVKFHKSLDELQKKFYQQGVEDTLDKVIETIQGMVLVGDREIKLIDDVLQNIKEIKMELK